MVAMAAIVAGCALVAFAAWAEVTRKARVAGILAPVHGILQLSAAAGGVLLEQRATEGEVVAAGQVIFVLDTDRSTTQGAAAALVAVHLSQRRNALQAERSARETQLRQRQQALADRQLGLQREMDQAQEEARLAQHRVQIAQQGLTRLQALARDGFIAEAQVQAKQDEWLDLRARAEAARRAVGGLERDLRTLSSERQAANAQWATDAARLDRELAGIEQEAADNGSRQTLAVRAPRGGRLTAVHVPRGAHVQAGQTLATLLPQGQGQGQGPSDPSTLRAELFAPSRTAGFVRPGQDVWVRYAAYPFQKFGMARGHVDSVSHTPVNPQDLPPGQAQALMQAAQSQEPMYRITVTLASQTVQAHGRPEPLKPGMALEADVLQERRAVWEWMFEPVLAARVRIKNLDSGLSLPSSGG